MSARRIAGLAVLSAVLLAGSTACADFGADLYWGDDAGNRLGGLTDTIVVPQAQPTTGLVLWDNQTYGSIFGTDYIEWVHLNFSASDVAALNPVGHWTWDPTLLARLEMDGGLGAANAIGRISLNPLGPWRPASPVRIGSLSIPTPAYVEGGDNDHLLSLKGGDPLQDNVTFMFADDSTAAAEVLGNMTLHDLTIRVLPEPATMALLGLGAAAALLRRKPA